MNTQRARGFTLLEALISAAFFFLAISLTVMSFMAGSQNFAASQDSIKACHHCLSIMDLITREILEAEPSSIIINTPGSITFRKFHNPTSEIQNVTWRQSETQVERSYTNGGASIKPMHFGDNIQTLTFQKFTNSCNNTMIRVTLSINSEVQASGGRRKIYEIFKDVCPRMDHTVDIRMQFN